jgi:hypothetical protein
MINSIYLKNINGRVFLSDTEPQEHPIDPDRVDHFLTVTLLPHQIIIFPKNIYPNMDKTIEAQLKYYDDQELR